MRVVWSFQLYLSSTVIAHAHDLLVSYRQRLHEVGRGPYVGGDTPSSGYVAVCMMLALCKHVSAYGFGLDATNGRDQVGVCGDTTCVAMRHALKPDRVLGDLSLTHTGFCGGSQMHTAVSLLSSVHPAALQEEE